MSENEKVTEVAETAEKTETPAKEKKNSEAIIELICAIFLGLTALATAWASWIGSLHGGNQATNYTTSNNVASDGNSRYNQAVQDMMNDMLLWNDISDLQLDYLCAVDNEDEATMGVAAYKLYCKLNDNCSGTILGSKIAYDSEKAVEYSASPKEYIALWMEEEDALVSPFFDQEFVDHYFADANEVLAQAEEYLEQGKKDNANGDAFGLVTVIYSVVLFLLGIIGIFKVIPCRKVVLAISIVGFVVATVYMFTLPMPTGFSIASYFGG